MGNTEYVDGSDWIGDVRESIRKCAIAAATAVDANGKRCVKKTEGERDMGYCEREEKGREQKSRFLMLKAGRSEVGARMARRRWLI